MSARYFIENGQTISPPMGLDWNGCMVSFLFFNGAGAPVAVTGMPVVSQSLYDTGDIWKAVNPFSNGEWRFNGPASRVRVNLAGVTGFSTYRVIIWRTSDPMPLIPDGAYAGLRGQIVQDYNAANVKLGAQFYIQYNLPQLAANTQHKIELKTGAKRVTIKARDFYALGQFVNIQIFKQPTVTPATGTPIPVQNFNDENPQATTVEVMGGVTAPSNGASWGGTQRLFGASTAGQRTGQSLPPGGERVLKLNSNYLIVISNTDTGGSSTADCDYFLTWYEGDLDLPIKPQ